jgi:subtilisin family serine protease
MPLAATAVPAFLGSHPSWDGRGVLIGIMDSGIDVGVAGFDSTTGGRPKVLDLRDFSGEGLIPLRSVTPEGDSVAVAGRHLVGISRVRGRVAAGPLYAGVIRERALGNEAGSDLNDNGVDSDTLALIIGRASDGWVLFADTDGDGSLADELPVHDYLVGRETFGWHRPGALAPLTLAVNLNERFGAPVLDLFFDTSGHGTHVAGIAAARGIGGVPGFNGVAPGAQLLGLKIARNDFGGLTTTGSVMAALDYAIRFAAVRGLPLVLNMSFGVGNEREGASRLDAMLDSVLAAHPEIVFVTSAGNDGPGLSTVDFPGSARRAITVGATEPWVLSAGAKTGRPAPDALLFFSSRGGELGKPDVVAPGIAYSTVPRWNVGDEFKAGTSMSAPHVAGLVAILLSGSLDERHTVRAEDVRRALTGSARPVAGETAIDEGAGVPNVDAAWRILREPAPPAEFDVEVVGRPGMTAAFVIAPIEPDTLVRFRIIRRRGAGSVALTLTSNAPWLRSPSALRLNGPVDTITLVQHPPWQSPGVHVGVVTATANGVAGPLLTLVTTVVNPEARRAVPVRVVARLAAGALRRATFAVDSGRPFRVRVAAASKGERLVAALHQPGGAPVSGENGIPGGAGNAAAIYDVDGRDAAGGYYEAVAVASYATAVTASLAVDHAPVSLHLGVGGRDSVVAIVSSLRDSTASGRFNIGLLGAERSLTVSGTGGADVSTGFPAPGWGRRLIVDIALDPAQWLRFTDFGLTVVDQDGRIVGKNPVNYALGRLTAELPLPTKNQELRLVLSPGFADPGSLEQWSARVTIRLEADRPAALEAVGGEEFELAAGASTTFRARVGDLPWPIPPGFVPLAIFLAESSGISWSWQIPLPPPPGGVTR